MTELEVPSPPPLQPVAKPDENPVQLNPPPPSPQRAFASVAIQALPLYSAHEVNTVSAPLKITGMSHTEGGWPAEVDPTDGEQVARWRKKVERDEDYIRTVLHLGSVVEDLVRQNNAVDIYTDYFADVEPLTLEPPEISTLTALRHPSGVRREVQAMVWHNFKYEILATAFASETGNQGHGLCTIFDINRPTAPLTNLSSLSSVLCLAYNLREASILGAGQRNGQFALFDTRQGPEPVGVTDPQCSHTDCLTAMSWTQSKTGTEFITASLEGTVAWWDSRKLNERLESIPLRERGSSGSGTATSAGPAPLDVPCMAATCLEYSAAAGPAKFMVGTSSGAILSGNRKARSPADRITGSFTGHVSPITALSRHPFFPKYFLSIGDWTARVWSEDLHVPLVTTPCRAHYLSGGAWSQNRPSVFFCTGVDGSLEVWDLLQNHAAPVLTTTVADCALKGLALQNAGGLVAAGCQDGTTLILRPSEGLLRSQGDEKAEFAAMLERESGRERALEKAGKEAKTRAKREAARAAEPVTRVTEADLVQVMEILIWMLSITLFLCL